MPKKLTVRSVEALQPGQTIWDAAVTGFGCRCRGRSKIYVLKARIDSQQRWLTIGKHGSPWTTESARREARRLLGDIAKGIDPANARDERNASLTVSEALNLFLEQHVHAKLRPKTATAYGSAIDTIVRPALGRLRLDAVKTTHVAKMHNDRRTTPYVANRALAITSKFLVWCERQGYRPIGSNPALGIEKYRERKRERFLSRDELTELGAVLNVSELGNLENPYVIAAIRLLILTGARLNEILTLRWDYVDFERALLLLPESKTGAKAIPLNTAAIDVLKCIPRAAANPYVIVGNVTGQHLVNIQKPWRRIRADAGLDDVRIHDLRHSFASVAAAQGASLLMIGKLLGHTQAATTARYAHLTVDPVREVNEAAGQAISASMG